MGTVGLRTKCDPPVVSSSDNRAERYAWPGRRHDESPLVVDVTGAAVACRAVWAAAGAAESMMGNQIKTNRIKLERYLFSLDLSSFPISACQ